MKRLKFFLAIFLVFISANISYAYDFCVDGVYYRLMDDGISVAVTGEGANYAPFVYVPDQVNFRGKSYDVVRIDDMAFLEYMEGRSIRCFSIGTVTEIGNYAFSQYSVMGWQTTPLKVIFRQSQASCNYNSYAFHATEECILIPLGSKGSYQTRGWNHTIEYNPDLFSAEKINEMALYFENDHLKYHANLLDNDSKATVRGYTDDEESIIIPEQTISESTVYTISEIAPSALSNSQAKSLTLSSKLEAIHEKAFNAMPNLENIICHISTPFPIPSDVFGPLTYQVATLYVPKGQVNTYLETEGWSQFENIKEIGNDDTELPQLPQCKTPIISYSNGQLEFSCPTTDVQFVYSISTATTGSTLCESGKVPFTPTFIISVYAIKNGYTNSELVTKELPLSFEGMDGDLNKDGQISVSEVTELVNKILQNKK